MMTMSTNYQDTNSHLHNSNNSINLNNQSQQQITEVLNEKKEEKIAAARQKLKQFKKETKTHQNGIITNLNGLSSHVTPISPEEITNTASGRSSPSSIYSSRSTQSNSRAGPITPIQSEFPSNSLNILNPDSPLSQAQFKEQLQLHVQTIGILVAEKAELQSKLQQQTKKSDKKQDECDELMGRLKASRQKITDLEKLVQQLSSQQNSEQSSNSPNIETNRLQSELSSKEMLIDELRIRLDESNEKLSIKQQETQKLAQLTLDLKSQLEIMQLKMSQLLNSEQIQINNQDLDKELEKLKEENLNLTNELKEANSKLEKQKEDLKQEYQNYVDRLQRQVENLVDQINRMTDERESSFSKIDRLEDSLKNANKQNESLNQKIQELTSKLGEKNEKPNEFSSKIDILENEVKYFKQQIEILLHEQASFKSIIQDKDQSIENLSKLLENYESDREKFNTLLEQTHNDKQTISRILKQNNELKSQLTELQDAYVNVTKVNLDLTTQLQSEQFKLKSLESKPEVNEQIQPSSEWGDEPGAEENHQLDSPKENTLMDSIRKRIEDLEKENKDLNDYISLINKQQNDLVDELNGKIRALENEKSNLLKEKRLNSSSSSPLVEKQELTEEKLNSFKLLEEKFNKVMQTNADLKEKNQELEHVVQQLQFESETIIDYITMYQMERKKLNEKYKIKDEALRTLSIQLNVNKLALVEVNNYLNAYVKLNHMDSESNGETSQLSPDENKQKREFILAQVQNLLNNLTQTSSSALSTLSNELTSSSQINSSKTGSKDLEYPSLSNNIRANQGEIDQKSVAKFRSETVICSNCYGDLFIV